MHLSLSAKLGKLPMSLFSGILDLYPGAAAAYSLEKLRTGVGNVVNVRRSSDDAEQDFTAAQVSDGTLTTFTGAGDGFVETWYDQSGNGRHATQTTAANQPQIVDGGALVTGGIDFDGVNDGLQTANMTLSSDNYAAFAISTSDDTNQDNQTVFRLRANGGIGTVSGVFYEQVDPTTSNTLFAENTVADSGANAISANAVGQGTLGSSEILVSLLYGQSEILGYKDGALEATLDTVRLGTTPIGTVSLTEPLQIGYNFGSSDRGLNGKLNALVIYPTDQSANRAAIEANLADQYGITLA